jgi:catechol 2,3-dioxygenase-like lactoylglutathione lyase family enzyme
MITNLNTVSLYVRDQQRAKQFYVDTLGFELTTDADMGPMGRWIEVAPKGARTAFVLADAAGFGKEDRVGSSADITLHCSDVRTLHAELAAKGVPVTEPETKEWGTFMKITDPDGHQLVVSER